MAVGNLTGTLRTALGDVIGTVDRTVRLPVAIGAASSCDILHLTLGPLDLNLLGLVVHLDRVKLDITARRSGQLARQPAVRDRGSAGSGPEPEWRAA